MITITNYIDGKLLAPAAGRYLDDIEPATKIYFYKMTTDNDGAPCVQNGLLSLAICKRMIRRTAKEENIIIGFGGKKNLGEKLIYVAEIEKVEINGVYYSNSKFKDRPDCIYEWIGNELRFIEGSKFHDSGCRDKDVGHAGDREHNANVLTSRKFVYFGNLATDDYKKEKKYDVIKASIERLTQGHRINHPPELAVKLKELFDECIEKYGNNPRPASPSNKSGDCPCYKTEGEVQVVETNPGGGQQCGR